MDRVSSSAARGAIHSTKISGNFGSKLNGSVRSNRKSFEKTGPPFEVDQFSRSDRLEFQLNGSRPHSESETVLDYFIWDHTLTFHCIVCHYIPCEFSGLLRWDHYQPVRLMVTGIQKNKQSKIKTELVTGVKFFEG